MGGLRDVRTLRIGLRKSNNEGQQRRRFSLGYVDSRIAACGGVRVHEHDVRYGEIKRVFVDEQHRGKRLAIKMMDHLERYLTENGITIARLEAGPKQPEALKLYRKLGYQERGPFGSYAPDPLSVFMEKNLDQ